MTGARAAEPPWTRIIPTPRPAHPLPRHTNKTLQAYCRPPSLAISRFSSGFPYSPLCPPPACIHPSMSNTTHLPHPFGRHAYVTQPYLASD